MKHGFLMMLACLVPIAIIALLPVFGIKAGILSSMAFLICPLMHIGMMVFMSKSKEGHACCKSSKPAESQE